MNENELILFKFIRNEFSIIVECSIDGATVFGIHHPFINVIGLFADGKQGIT